MALSSILIAVILDWLLGDPYTWPHPIKFIGNYISWFMKISKKWTISKYWTGFILWMTTVGLSVSLTICLLYISNVIHPILYFIVSTYLAYAILASKSLAVEAMKVYNTLVYGSIEDARQQVGMIVGRDTTQLSQSEICNATIETVAENTSDGVIGPLLCLFIGGPALAIAYKAINTLDSMVGYKTEQYKKIGMISARVDDLVNLIPARITWICLCLSSIVLQLNSSNALKIGWRDRYKHASPNSGFCESVVAGALAIQLGGGHIYHGEYIEKDTIGDNIKAVENNDIITTIQMMYIATIIALLFFILIKINVGIKWENIIM